MKKALAVARRTREGESGAGVTRTYGRRAVAKAARPAAYLEWLQTRCASVELLGLRLQQGQSVVISNVYVPIVTTESADTDPERGSPRRKDHPREFNTLVPLLNRLGRGSLLVSGDAGTGKSTFCDVEDLSGNVWEWTRSLWVEKYPYQPDYTGALRENLKAGNDTRVVRGGAFYFYSWLARSAYRVRLEPDLRNYSLGFRVVVSPFTSDL